MHYLINLYSGRIARKNYVLGLLFFIFCGGMAFSILILPALKYLNKFFGLGLVALLFVVFIAHAYSLHVRRLHDLGYNGWLVFLGFVPLVGLILIILLTFVRGQESANKYGEAVTREKFFDIIFGLTAHKKS